MAAKNYIKDLSSGRRIKGVAEIEDSSRPTATVGAIGIFIDKISLYCYKYSNKEQKEFNLYEAKRRNKNEKNYYRD